MCVIIKEGSLVHTTLIPLVVIFDTPTLTLKLDSDTESSCSTASRSSVFNAGAITITQPTQLTLSGTPTNVLCNGGTGSVSLTAGGGTVTTPLTKVADVQEPATAEEEVTTQLSDETTTMFNVYPNPSRDIFNISFGVEENQNVAVFVFDMTGKMVRSEEHSATSGNNQIMLDMSKEAAGVYLLQVNCGNTVNTKKIMLQR